LSENARHKTGGQNEQQTNKLASAQKTQGLAPETEQVLVTIQDGSKRFVVAGCWIDELDNWSFLEYWVNGKAIAWRPLPEPFTGGL